VASDEPRLVESVSADWNTTTMTDTNTKVRSLILTALMVVSVFGGSIAFAGSAAAASDGTISAANTATGETTTYTATVVVGSEATSLNNLRVDFSGVDNYDGDLSGVIEEETTFGVDQGNDGSETTTDVSATVSSVSSSNNGETLDINADGSTSLSAGDEIVLVFDGAKNPDTNGFYSGTLDINQQSSGEQTSATLQIGDDENAVGSSDQADLNAQAAAEDENVNANLDFSTVVYSGEVLTIDGFEGNELVNVREVTSRDGNDITSNQVDQLQAEDGVIELDTGDLDGNGDYFVRGQASGNDVSFELATHTLDVTVDPTTVENGDSGTVGNGDIEDSESEFDVQTNRAGTLLYQVDSESLEDAELKQIFQEYEPTDTELENADVDWRPASDYASATSDDYDADDEEEYDDDDPVDEDGILIAFEDEEANELTFTDIDTGDYTFDVSHVTTTAADSVDVSVTETEDGDATFDSSIYTTAEGDRALMTVSLDSAETAKVQIGEYDNVNYEAVVTVEDDGDGEVSFWFNTYSPQDEDAFVLSEASNDDGDSLTWNPGTDRAGDENIDESEPLSEDSYVAASFDEGALSTASYDIAAYVGDTETDVGTFDVNERTVGGVQMWTLANDEIGDISELEDVYTAVDEGTLTQGESNAVTQGDSDQVTSPSDAVVHQIQVSGIYGAVETGSETGQPISAEQLGALLGATYDDEAADGGDDSSPQDEGAELVISQTDDTTEANSDPLILDIKESADADALTIIPDSENGSLFIVAQPDSLQFDRMPESEIEDLTDDESDNFDSGFSAEGQATDANTLAEYNDAFDVEFFIPEESGLASQDVSSMAGFELVERDVTFNTNADDEVVVGAASEQTISGTTTLAPGAEITVRARATGDNPFLKTADVTVGTDGAFEGTFDFSDASNGTEFEVTVPNEGVEDDAEIDGIVSDSAQMETPTPTPEPATDTPEPETDTPEPATDTPEPATDTPTEADGGDGATATETSGSQPGFGGAVAIVALAGAALIALRRNN